MTQIPVTRPNDVGRATGKIAIAWVLVLGLWMAFMLIASGTTPRTTAVLTAIVLAQMAGGAVWWAGIRQRHLIRIPELVGMGIVLGSLATILSSQALRGTVLASWGPAVPAIATALVLAIAPGARLALFKTLKTTSTLNRRDNLGLLVGVGAGIPPIVAFWRAHPLRWEGSIRYHLDIPFHEALSHSVHTFGPNESVFAVGQVIRYHWFSHAWIGSIADFTAAEPFVVLTRLVPIMALLGTALVGWTWARRLSQAWWVPPLAVLLLTSGSYVGLLGTRGNQLIPLSPSQSFTTAWLLAFCIVVTDLVASRSSHPVGLALLGVLGVALIGGKASHALAIAGGVAGLFLYGLLKADSRRAMSLIAFASGFGVIAGYLVLLSGAAGNPLEFGFSNTASSAYRLEPLASAAGIYLGTGSLLLAIWARWFGVAGYWQSTARRNTPESFFGAGVFVIATTALIFTSHPGTSQLYFALSASAILSVLSAHGMGLLAEPGLRDNGNSDARSNRVPYATRILIAGISAAAIGVLTARSGSAESGWLRWVAPLMVWLAAILAARLFVDSWKAGRLPRTLLSLTLAGVLAVASIATLQSTSLLSLIRSAPEAVSVSEGMTTEELEAALWLRSNSQPEDLVLTNRLCTAATETPPDCSSRWFLTAAVSGRRMWIEGYDYGVGIGKLPDWASERVDVALRFTNQPADEEHATLWNRGVRWVWLDSRIEHQEQWEPFGAVRFHDGLTTIVQLLPPGGGH